MASQSRPDRTRAPPIRTGMLISVRHGNWLSGNPPDGSRGLIGPVRVSWSRWGLAAAPRRCRNERPDGGIGVWSGASPSPKRRGSGGTAIHHSVGRYLHRFLPPGHPARVSCDCDGRSPDLRVEASPNLPGPSFGLGSSGLSGVARRSQLRGQSRIWRPCGSSTPCSLFILQLYSFCKNHRSQAIFSRWENQHRICP